MDEYPRWRYYPSREASPSWVSDLVAVFEAARASIDSREVQGLQSDGVLAEIRSGLQALGYVVETSKKKVDRIIRPVLFGDKGLARVNYEVDAVLEVEGVLLEVAGRGCE